MQLPRIAVTTNGALRRVKIGMTMAQVHRIGQQGDRCGDWPHQKPPTCGRLHYFTDMWSTETSAGKLTGYVYDRAEIIYRNGVVVMIRR